MLNFHLFVNYLKGKAVFKDFPKSKTWDDLWKVINERGLKCLKVLKKKSYLTKDDYDDYRMELAIPRKKSRKFLAAMGQPLPEGI